MLGRNASARARKTCSDAFTGHRNIPKADTIFRPDALAAASSLSPGMAVSQPEIFKEDVFGTWLRGMLLFIPISLPPGCTGKKRHETPGVCRPSLQGGKTSIQVGLEVSDCFQSYLETDQRALQLAAYGAV